jgi:hypothetical protein
MGVIARVVLLRLIVGAIPVWPTVEAGAIGQAER